MKKYVTCLLVAGIWSACASFESVAIAQETAVPAPNQSAKLKLGSAAEAVQQLKGSWTIVSGVNQGKPIAADSLKGSRVIFGENTIIVLDAELKELYKTSYKLTGQKPPFQINMTTEVPNQEPTRGLGLIEFRDSGLRLCYALPGGQRPTKFESREGSKHMLFEMKRIAAAGR